MKKIVLVPLLFFATLPLLAAANIDALRSYVTKALAKCPDQKITVQPIDQPGPFGFLPFTVAQTSSDTACGREAIALYSPATSQVILGTVFALPLDNRSVEVRAAETASRLLKQNVNATITGFPLPDGLRPISLTKETSWGPFSYHAFIDSAGRFLIVGSRGNLLVSPGTTLIESLGIEKAVRRGNPKSPVKIIELSDFECPTCAKAHKSVEPLIAKNLKKVDYKRLDLPLFEHHEWALPAAMGARAIQQVAPSKYWAYVNFVFENQEAVDKTPSFDTTLQNFCEDHDIDWKKVEKIYRSTAERADMLEQVSRAFDMGVNSTPTYIINGQIMGFGPSGSFTIAEIKRALGVK
ncbi:MAG TPA: thioredoxin domain-containing protein [Thermoanaerobaculia bacterium]|nr:thioredoxin domain-containing protein [Thermoanaerobaculia bacterium]